MTMELILPPTNLRTVDLKHTEGIQNAVDQMQLILDMGRFPGKHRYAFALHHAEVSKKPFNFFVMHKDYEYLFGTRVIINPKILERRGDRIVNVEGCLSFPFREMIRVQRHPKVMAQYEVSNPDGTRTSNENARRPRPRSSSMRSNR